MKRSRTRGGFTLLEISVSIVILGAMASLIAQALLWRAAQQRSIQWRELAVVEAGNLMERAAALDANDLSQANLEALPVPAGLLSHKPPAAIHWRLEPVADEPAARRINLEIQLPGKAGADGRSVCLTGWKYGAMESRKSQVDIRNEEDSDR